MDDWSITFEGGEPMAMKAKFFENLAKGFPCLDEAPISPFDPEILAVWTREQEQGAPEVETARLLLHLYGCEGETMTKTKHIRWDVDAKRAEYNSTYKALENDVSPKTDEVIAVFSAFNIGPFSLENIVGLWSDKDFEAFIALLSEYRRMGDILNDFRDLASGGY